MLFTKKSYAMRLFEEIKEHTNALLKLYEDEVLKGQFFLYSFVFSMSKKIFVYRLKKNVYKLIKYISEIEGIGDLEIKESREKKISLKGMFEKRLYVDILFVSRVCKEDIIYFEANADRYIQLHLHGSSWNNEYAVFSCHKLARDKTFDDVDDGSVIVYKTLSYEEYRKALLDKLLEEVAELIDARNKDNSIEEIGDVLDVFDTFLKSI